MFRSTCLLSISAKRIRWWEHREFFSLGQIKESAELLLMLLVENLRFVEIRVLLSGPKVMVLGTCRRLHLVVRWCEHTKLYSMKSVLVLRIQRTQLKVTIKKILFICNVWTSELSPLNYTSFNCWHIIISLQFTMHLGIPLPKFGLI